MVEMIRSLQGYRLSNGNNASMIINNEGLVTYCNRWPDSPDYDMLYMYYLTHKA